MPTTTVVCPCGRKYDPGGHAACPELDCAEPVGRAQAYADWYAETYGEPLRARPTDATVRRGVGSFLLGDRAAMRLTVSPAGALAICVGYLGLLGVAVLVLLWTGGAFA